MMVSTCFMSEPWKSDGVCERCGGYMVLYLWDTTKKPIVCDKCNGSGTLKINKSNDGKYDE